MTTHPTRLAFNMKTAHIVSIGAIASLGLLAYTNPRMDHYEHYVQQNIVREANEQGGVVSVFGALFGKVAGSVVANATLRHDYVFFSTYETNLREERVTAIGVLNNFLSWKHQRTGSLQTQQPR